MTTILAWLGVAAGGLLGAAAAMALLGCLLPRHYVAARSVVFPAVAADVWRAAADFPGQVAWRRGLSDVERLPDRDGAEVWRERHGRAAVALRTLEATPPGRIVRQVADEGGPVRGRWDILVAPIINESTCRVTVIEQGEVANPLRRFVHRFATGQAAAAERYLRDLAARFGAEPRFMLPAGPEMDPPARGGAGPR